MTNTVRTQDEAQIRQLLADRAVALRERDPERFVARFAPEIVRYTLAPPLAHTGPDPDGMRAWLATFDGPLDSEIRDLDVAVGGDVAFCHGISRLSAKPVGAPEGFDLWFRLTVCLRRIDGEWRITHEHESTPFYMDGSFKAAVDLKP